MNLPAMVRRSVRLALLTLLAACLGVPGAVRAWGPRGHETVGAIAQQLIAGSPAEAQVRQHLGGMDLAQAGLWADCIKGLRLAGEGGSWVEPGRHPECRPFEAPQETAAAIAYVRLSERACAAAGPADEACHRRYHYTDVAVQRDGYRRGLAGTRDDDLVAAVSAALARLQGRPVPPPFRFDDATEALRLLVHWVADLHQPLHVGAVYLDEYGDRIDPDRQRHGAANDTVGGNRLIEDGLPLHRRWDDVPEALGPRALGRDAVAWARQVPPTPGAVADWPALWASDTLQAARAAYAPLRFGAALGWPPRWPVLGGGEAARAAQREALQRRQLIKAGARLAQLLQAIWP